VRGGERCRFPAKGQLSRFLDQAPFNGKAPFQGTFTFTSDVPVGVVALPGFINERDEFLLSTLPVADLGAAPGVGVQVIPEYADGGGWVSQVVLVNPADTPMTGTLNFVNQNGLPALVSIGVETNTSFVYGVPPRSSQKWRTSGSAMSPGTGSVRIVPSNGQAAPTPLVVISFKPATVTVSEASFSSASSTAVRTYVESSAAAGQAGQIQSGIAVANTSSSTATVRFELSQLDGSSIPGLNPAFVELRDSAQITRFVAELFPALPATFKGILRISTDSTGLAVAGLRARYNERTSF
jgi:hypothetical protein